MPYKASASRCFVGRDEESHPFFIHGTVITNLCRTRHPHRRLSLAATKNRASYMRRSTKTGERLPHLDICSQNDARCDKYLIREVRARRFVIVSLVRKHRNGINHTQK
jgi:hypothetical protein